MPYVGEICALLTAVCWTFSSTAFAIASRAVGPFAANHFRLVVAFPLLLLLAWGVLGSPWPVEASRYQLAMLVASGCAGLVLGDLGYFYALAKIGPRLCSVIYACWPAWVVAMEAACGRPPGTAVSVGIALMIAGVAVVLLRNRDGAAWNPHTTARQWVLGVAGALFGALGQAAGIELAGPGMAAADGCAAVAPLHATVVRMATAVVGLQVAACLQRDAFAARRVFTDRRALRAAAIGTVFGPIGGVWLSMVARAHASATDAVGIVSALMATTPIFMMPLARVVYRAPIGLLGIAGTLLAVGGAALCLLAR